MDMTQAQAVSAGKPYWSMIQGWGDLEGETGMWRLPTNAESKFHTFYSLLKDAEGIITFPYYRAIITPARPAEAYPYGGQKWVDTVATSRNDEVSLLGPALRYGSIGASAVSSSDADVIGDVYQDPDTDIFYVVAANTELGGAAPTITLNLLGLPAATPVAVRPLFESGSVYPIALTGGTTFSDSFSSYEVHIYEVMLTSSPADCAAAKAEGYQFIGDFNGDCTTNIVDLEMVANAWLDCLEHPAVVGCLQ